jgi:hypothetical protein
VTLVEFVRARLDDLSNWGARKFGKRPSTAPIGAIEDLHEDDAGLFVQVRLFDNDVVEQVGLAIAGGAIQGMPLQGRRGAADGRSPQPAPRDPGDRTALLRQNHLGTPPGTTRRPGCRR